MTRESAEAKGARLLTEGRLVVQAAGPGYFAATVRGSGDVHQVRYGRHVGRAHLAPAGDAA